MTEIDKLERAIVINDLHIPFEDKRAIRLVLDFIKDFKPNEVVLNGDILDCWELSKFDKNPRVGKRFNEELEMGKEFFNQLRKVFKGRIVYLLGNHEYRLQSYIIRNSPVLAELDCISLQDLLKLDSYNVEIISSGLKENYYKYGELYIGHFNKVSKHSAYTAKNLIDDKGVSILQGHTHRIGFSVRTLFDSKEVGGWENGCLCDKNPNYVLHPNWQHGFSVVYKWPNNKRFQVQQIPIVDYKFFFGDKIYSI